MTVFLNLVLDAYRELNSRRLFWIVLALSAMIVVFYASVGFDDKGMFIFFGLKHFESDLLADGTPMARLLYRGIFATFMVPIWLGWIATILALISTAPIFPEFIASGAIDLTLSKPVTRLGLFLCKYAASLLFVVLQASVFCVGVFLAMGWRLGDWEWKVFTAIPILTLLFSYLYSFCVFLGVWTRSTLAALLLTMLMWFGIYTVSATEAVVMMFRTNLEAQSEFAERRMARRAADTQPATNPSVDSEYERGIKSLNRWLRVVQVIRWPLPKTSETVDLMNRMLSREGDINIMDLVQGRVVIGPDGRPIKREARHADERSQELLIEEAGKTKPAFIILTSLLFELVMVGGAAWIFCRRDF